ncbi:30S ribosomal protein S12 methylthiotransferase RimO [Caldanaerobacter sp.]|uniref:30S ribosomal protein S12 methylthiotransferase RimO n=1 Tax=Caldanaerobacter sp. TaxID=2930036 RepID=UPI003C72C45B
MKNVGLISLGCPKNSVDSEKMLFLLKENGYNIVSDERKADIIIVNTCAFIEDAKKESIETIIQMGQLKKKRLKYLIATGCLSERYNKELMKELPELDAVIGTGDFTEIVKVIEKLKRGEKVLKYGHPDLLKDEGISRVLTTPPYYAYLKIAEGCSNACSFCIIPKLRGKYRSRKIEDILKEAEELVKRGVKELILIAQDTTKYGIDLYKKPVLPELLRELAKIEGVKWIRLLYAYPDSVTDELIEEIKKNEKVVKYIDIPLQHSSESVLRRMNRGTTRDKIEEVISKLRSIPGMVIRTTFIVGFPGETEEEFENLKRFLIDKRFERVGVFTYSREEGTKAYYMKPQIKRSVKLKRQRELMEIQQKISYEFNFSKIGSRLEVMIEGFEDGIYYGRSYMDAPEIDGIVYVKSNKKLLPGDFISVTIKDAFEYDLLGEY